MNRQHLRMIVAALIGICQTSAFAVTATFQKADLVISNRGRQTIIRDVIDEYAFFSTIHAVAKRGDDMFVVFGSSELSRGWPPRNGNCGAGIETFIRWLHIRDGRIIEQQEGLYESCRQNRSWGNVQWKGHKLVWSADGSEREGTDAVPTFVTVNFSWTYDPSHPDAGITETKEKGK